MTERGNYRVIFADPAARAIRKLPRELQRRVVAKVEALAADPRPAGCVKLSGHENLYRIRVGVYRIVYEVHDDRRVVIVVIAAHRRESNRGL